jgi:hypothetical protein
MIHFTQEKKYIFYYRGESANHASPRAEEQGWGGHCHLPEPHFLGALK